MADLTTYFRALADRKRLRIVQLLATHGRMTVTQLGDDLSLSQPLISWHLRILRKARIVRTERAGRQVWCFLDRSALEEYQGEARRLFGLESASEGAQETSLKAVGEG